VELKNSLQVESLQVRGKWGEGEERGKRGKAVDDEATVAASDLDLLGFFRTYPASKVVKTSTQSTCMTL